MEGRFLLLSLFLTFFLKVSPAKLEYFAQARVTDSDIVKLNEIVPASASESTRPALSPTAIQLSSWSFTLADSVLIAYASNNDRDVALQQITQVWEDALAPQVTDVQVVLVDDRPDLSNPTNFPDSMASIVTYAVLGNTPLPVDAGSAKLNFRKLISATRIPVIPVNLTSSSESFAFLESLGLDYHTLGERDVLLQQIKLLWQQILASKATHVQMTLYSDTPTVNGSEDHHYITYLITGDGSTRLTAISLEQEFRRLLLASNLISNGVWGISGSDTLTSEEASTTLATTTERIKPTTTVYIAPQEPFEIMDSVLLPYVNAAQVNQLLQQIKEYWMVVLGPRFVTRDIRFVNSTLENVTVSGKVVLVYYITYEISGLTDTKVDVEKVRGEFHHAILELLSPDDSPIVVLENSNNVPVLAFTSIPSDTTSGTTSVSTSPSTTTTITTTTTSSNPSTIFVVVVPVAEVVQVADVTTDATTTVATTNTMNTNNISETEVNSVETSSIDQPAKAVETLIRKTLAGTDIHEVYSSVFFENIVFTLATGTNLESAMQIIRHLWLEAFGNNTVDVQLSVYQNRSASSTTSDDTFYNVDYIVLALNKEANVDLLAVKNRFRFLLAHSEAVEKLISHAESVTSVTSGQLHNNVILDSIAVTSENTVDVNTLITEITKIWKNLLGDDAEGVQVAIYRDSPRSVVGPIAGNADAHEFFYVVLVQTKKSDLDVDQLRIRVEESIKTLNISGITVLPKPAHQLLFNITTSAVDSNASPDTLENPTETNGPLLGFAVHDNITLNYTTDAERSLALEALRGLWKQILGPNAIDVRIVVSNESLESQSKSDSVHYIPYTVFVVTKSTDYDQEEVKRKFHETVDTSSIAFAVPELLAHRILNSNTTDVVLKNNVTAGNVRASTHIPTPIESYLIYDNVYFNYTTEPERQSAVETLTKMWTEFLGPTALEVQLRPYSDVKDDVTGFHKITYMILILSQNATWNLEATRKAFQETLPSSTRRFVAPISEFGPVRKPDSNNFIIIPTGLSISYSTQKELGNMLQVIHGLWQKLLGSNATSVDVTLYNDTINQEFQTSDGTLIHDISYVVIIQTNQKDLDVVALKSKFEELLPSSEMLISDATTEQSVTSNPPEDGSTNLDHTIVSVGPALVAGPLPSGLVISDHIWLVYKNETERKAYLDQMRLIWEKVLADLNSTNVFLVFDYENQDNTSSDRDDSHEVFYTVLATTTSTNLSLNDAKLRFRKDLPTGNFMFGFDPLEDAYLLTSNDSSLNSNPVEEKVTDEWTDTKSVNTANLNESDDLSKTVITDTALLQFIDDGDRDAELEEIKKTWSRIFDLPISQVEIHIVKDTIKSTDASLRPGSIHDLIYAITSSVNTTDEKYLEKWLSYEEALTKLPFVVNAAKLSTPATPPNIFGVSIESLINNSKLLNILLQKFSNRTSSTLNSSESDSALSESSSSSSSSTTSDLNAETSTANNTISSFTVVNGTIVLNYSTDSERQASISDILTLWHKQFGFDPSVVNLTLSPANENVALLNESSSWRKNGSLHIEIYKIWSSLTVNLAVIKTQFEKALTSRNYTVIYNVSTSEEDFLPRKSDLFVFGNLPNSTPEQPTTQTLNSTLEPHTTQTVIRRFLNS